MSDKKILVVDDEEDIRDLLIYNLEKEGYKVIAAADGESAIDLATRQRPDLILLDVMLPGIDGHQVCLRLKADETLKRTPVIMLSARTDETDQVVGLKLGADDYMTKPFSPKILVAKVDAVLRRTEKAADDQDEVPIVRCHGLEMNPNDYSVSLKGQGLKLTAVEYRILYFLARKPGRVYTRERIIEEARGDDVIITDRTVDVHILSIRRKLGDDADMIETVRGVGYRVRTN